MPDYAEICAGVARACDAASSGPAPPTSPCAALTAMPNGNIIER